jgi:uncharacterized membrane protein
LIFIFLCIGTVTAIEQAEYYAFVEENGNAVIAITFYGEGEITIPLPEDVSELTVEGGLYIMEEKEAIIAIGTTEKAAVLYKTAMLTQKSGEEWSFFMDVENVTDKTVIIALPSSTVIKNTNPGASIESGEITKIHLENPEEISISYSFPPTFESENQDYALVNLFVGLAILAIIITVFYVMKNRKKVKLKQRHFLQTLSENESRVVELLLSARKALKRNFIEKKLGIAKSSLAATINNLERKGILEVDRTYSTHIIKLKDIFK